MNGFVGVCDEMNVVCPQPRRIDRPVRYHAPDFEDGDQEILQLLLKKGDESNQLNTPFFCGSPPSRVSNPVIHDERFRDELTFCPFMPVSVPNSSSTMIPSTSVSSRQNYMPTKFGFKPAAMRIEGFDCLNRDRRGCSITAKA